MEEHGKPNYLTLSTRATFLLMMGCIAYVATGHMEFEFRVVAIVAGSLLVTRAANLYVKAGVHYEREDK